MAENLEIIIGANTQQAQAAVKSFNNELNKVNPAAKNASFALLGVNRVIQDLPFGFAAIGNNIEELPRAFQSLSEAAKESGQSISKVLLSSLTGAGGIGLAVSAVTTAITFATNGFGMWTRGIKSAKEANDQAKDSFDKILSGLAQESVKVQELVEFIGRETTSREQRVAAIKELQSIAPAYFGTLNAEKATVQDITAAYNQFNTSLIQAAKAKVLESQLQDIIKERLDLENKLARPAQELAVIDGKAVTVRNFYLDTDRKIATGKQRLIELALTESKLVEQINNLKPPDLRIPPPRETKIAPDKLVVEPKEIQFSLVRAQKDFDFFGEEFRKQSTFAQNLKAIKIAPSINWTPAIQASITAQEKIDSIMKQLGESIASQLPQAIEGAAQAIGQAFGGGGFKSIAQGFLSILGDTLEAVGKAAIAAGVAMLNLKVALASIFANPTALIAVGALAVAAGAAIKASIPHFAEGGVVTRPTIGLFGEAGPEAIIPLNRLNTGGGLPATIELRLRGRDAVALVEMNKRSLNRVT